MLALLPARYRAYALDQRGHGDSERPACCYTIDDFAADTVAFLDAVGIEPRDPGRPLGAAPSSPGGWRRPTPSGSPGWC